MNKAHIWFFSQEFFSTCVPANQKHHFSAPSAALSVTLKCKPHGKKKENYYWLFLSHHCRHIPGAELLDTTCCLLLTVDLTKVLDLCRKNPCELWTRTHKPAGSAQFSSSVKKRERERKKLYETLPSPSAAGLYGNPIQTAVQSHRWPDTMDMCPPTHEHPAHISVI